MDLSRRNLLKTGFAGATALTILPSSLAFGQTVCGPQSCTIWAGQTSNAGTITVSNDSTNLYINIVLANGWTFRNVAESLKVWVGSDLTLIPMPPGGGRPNAGQFPPAQKVNATGTTYTMTIALVDAKIILPAGCGSTLYVVAHLDVTGPGGNNETAFGGCISGNNTKGAWWFYMTYTICCPVIDPPPVLGSCQTAFAKGGWVFVTDPKANPEILPSLRLIKNRWGWAINLTSTGLTSYDIWAGAGLNKLGNGFKVGTLIVNWDGTTVTVRYNLLAAYRLTETHVYAASTPPTTTAPGRYGYLSTHTAVEDVQSYEYTDLPLVDDGIGDTCGGVPCSGVWIIAHAVVCDAATP